MNKDEKKQNIKKAYEKPLLRIVNISSSIQTLGIGCKLNGVTVAAHSLPISCGISNGCVRSGS
jgi:hypothetical protein